MVHRSFCFPRLSKCLISPVTTLAIPSPPTAHRFLDLPRALHLPSLTTTVGYNFLPGADPEASTSNWRSCLFHTLCRFLSVTRRTPYVRTGNITVLEQCSRPVGAWPTSWPAQDSLYSYLTIHNNHHARVIYTSLMSKDSFIAAK